MKCYSYSQLSKTADIELPGGSPAYQLRAIKLEEFPRMYSLQGSESKSREAADRTVAESLSWGREPQLSAPVCAHNPPLHTEPAPPQ